MKIIRKRGIEIDPSDPFAPLYVEKPLTTGRQTLTLANLPELTKAVESLRTGEILTVPDLGTFGTVALWTEVCRHVKAADAKILDAGSGKTYDLKDMDSFLEAQEQVTAASRKRLTSAIMRGRAQSKKKTGPKQKLTDKQIKLIARDYWPHPEAGTAEQIAQECETLFGVSVHRTTLERLMKVEFGGDTRSIIMNRTELQKLKDTKE